MAAFSSSAPGMPCDDHYQILGIDSTATSQEIRKAYLRRSLKVHPDKQATLEARVQANEAFVRLKTAYDVLYDASDRAMYDLKRRARHSNHGGSGGASSKAPPAARAANSHANARSSTSSKRPQQDRSAPDQHQHNYNWNQRQQRWEGTQHQRNYHWNQHQQRWEGTHSSSSSSSSSSHQGRQQQQQQEQEQPRQHSNRNQESSKKQDWDQHTEHRGPSSRPRNSSSKPFGSNSQNARAQHPQQQQQRQQRQQQQSPPQTRKHKEPSPPKPTPAPTPKSPQKATSGFGKTAAGEYCKRCVKQGGYCYQHEGQSPSCANTDHSHHDAPAGGNSSTDNFRSSTSGEQNTKERSSANNKNQGSRDYGIRQSDGQACKRCQNQRGFCYQHKDQDPTPPSASTRQNRAHASSQGGIPPTKNSSNAQRSPIFGRRKDGQPCTRCQKQKRFCYQHLDQK